MAPRKQPIPGEELALKDLAKYCADTVIGYLNNRDAVGVESSITALKDGVCADIPGISFNDFAVMFLQKISEVAGSFVMTWFKKYGTTVVDVIVDDRLTKLEPYPLVTDQLMHILYSSVDRLKNLRHLHFGRNQKTRFKYLSNLKNCYLENLRTFGCRHSCTDEVLQVICERCPNLTTLDIQYSRNITSAGLDVLRRCASLMEVELNGCRIRAKDLIVHLLSYNKFENIAHTIYDVKNLMSFESGVYPKLNSMEFYGEDITSAVLKIIVKSFPMLETLFLYGDRVTGDLRSLRSLPFLNSLGIMFCTCNMKQVESLLTDVGNRYSSLSILVDASQSQPVVNIVYKTCKNIKFFRVYVQNVHRLHTITIPPFGNLEGLSVISRWYNLVHLQFTRLLALKKLSLIYCRADLESILLNHDNFPCIREIEELGASLERCKIIGNIIEENNFDVCYSRVILYENVRK